MSVLFSQTFPELSEIEHEILSLSKEINWLDGQMSFFASVGKIDASNDFAERLAKAIRKLRKLEKLKELNS